MWGRIRRPKKRLPRAWKSKPSNPYVRVCRNWMDTIATHHLSNCDLASTQVMRSMNLYDRFTSTLSTSATSNQTQPLCKTICGRLRTVLPRTHLSPQRARSKGRIRPPKRSEEHTSELQSH